jgi:hypothetical protein
MNSSPRPTSRKLLVSSQTTGKPAKTTSTRRPRRDMPREHTPVDLADAEPGSGLRPSW